MSNIFKWTVLGYSCAIVSNKGPINSLGEVVVYIDFDQKKFQIDLPDGGSMSGSYEKLLSGMIYQVDGMFGFFIGRNYYIFGNNPGFTGGYLSYPNSGTSDMVWISTPTQPGGPLLNSSSDNFYSPFIPKGEKISAICYLAGTMILTPQGERAIETLNPNDQVVVRRHGVDQVETVLWVGSARQVIDLEERHDDRAGYPVCFRANALGRGLPYRDLYVTSEHSLYLDGCFVPARMLVNGDSIAYDRSRHEFEYFHIEIETHGIVIANGVESETYLDTGNRFLFAQNAIEGRTIVHLSKKRSWREDACAMLNVTPDFVRTLWERFSPVSAEVLSKKLPISDDPALHLTREDGSTLAPYRHDGQTYLFRLDAQPRSYRITSRSVRSCDIIGPFLDDRREFGVLVSALTLWTSTGMKALPLKEGVIAHGGWHREPEHEGFWTTGSAELAFDDVVFDGQNTVILSVRLAGTKIYPVSSDKMPKLPWSRRGRAGLRQQLHRV